MKHKRWKKAVRAMKKAAVVANESDAALSIEPDGIHVHACGSNGVQTYVIVGYKQVATVKNIIPRLIGWMQRTEFDPETGGPLDTSADEETSEARLH